MKVIVVEDIERVERMENEIAQLKVQVQELFAMLANQKAAPTAPMMTPREVAARYKISPRNVRAAIADGSLRAIANATQRGGRAGVLVNSSDFEDWLRKRNTPRQVAMSGASSR